MEDVGLHDKELYYGDYDSRFSITVDESLYLDKDFINRKVKEGKLDVKSLNTFLIAGCASALSIIAMMEWITDLRPNEETLLLVTDINKEAFQNITRMKIEVPPKIKLQLFQGDLTEMSLKRGSVDYVRLDYTQNFIPLKRQKSLMSELHRITSDRGIVSSLVRIEPATQSLITRLRRRLSPASDVRIDRGNYGYNVLIPTAEYLQDAAKHSGFQMSFGERFFNGRDYDQHIIFEKPRK